MDIRIIGMHDRIMSFRHVADLPDHPRCRLRVIGHRVDFPQAISDTTASWFGFLFHDPVQLGSDAAFHPAQTALVLPPGASLRHRPLPGRRLLRSWWRCDGDGLARLVSRAELTPGVPLHLTHAGACESALLLLYHTALAPAPPAPDHVLCLIGHWLHATRSAAATSAPPGPIAIADVRRHLDRTWRQRHQLDDLARLAGCSRAQFCRRFRAATGCSPVQYVLRLRLDAARDQLTSSSTPIPDIATACGFADRYHFTRCFSARFGTGPAAWRQAHG